MDPRVCSRAAPDWRCVALRGLPPAAASPSISIEAAARALLVPHTNATVYVELDASRRLTARLAGGGGWEPALLLRARLAPDALAAGGEVRLAAGGALRVSLPTGAPPHHDLALWPDAALRAALALPPLSPLHIRGSAEYRCDVCGTSYENPNPLKVHIYLDCGEPTTLAFWRRVLATLRAQSAPLPAQTVPAAAVAAAASAPAALEALAAAWGARGPLGHECVYCGKLYSRKYGLKIHIRTHTGYKPLRCGQCARRFGDPSNLNKHVRLHAAGRGAGAARFRCGQCGAALQRRRDLLRHTRCKHPHTHAAHLTSTDLRPPPTS